MEALQFCYKNLVGLPSASILIIRVVGMRVTEVDETGGWQ
jgi:hypothetical protein